jgi:hypothetical protein
MSASPVTRPIGMSPSQGIPLNRLAAEGIPCNYSTTPGGTLYSTTPGGTRIVYDRSTLMLLRNSPLSRTPPNNMHDVPDVLRHESPKSKKVEVNGSPKKTSPTTVIDESQEQFEMDI